MTGEGYTPLHASILTSTIWLEDDRTRIVWLTLLALKDRHHYVAGSIPGIAHVARVPVEDCRRSIEKFLAPDPDSRTKENEGRRIVEADGGWRILNGEKFRTTRDPEVRRLQNVIAQRKHRKKSNASAKVSQDKPQKAHSEAESKAEAQSQPLPNNKEVAAAPVVIKEFPEHLNTARMNNKWQVWQNMRRGKPKPGNWLILFNEQVDWLSGFTEDEAFEILSSSIRNGWTGLFAPNARVSSNPKPKAEESQIKEALKAPRLL